MILSNWPLFIFGLRRLNAKAVRLGSSIRVRRMRLADLETIEQIETVSFAIPWSRVSFVQELTTNPFAHYRVAVREGRVIGYGGLWLVFDEAHLTNVAVFPEHRGRGAGGQIMRSLLRICDRRGCRRITLEVRRSNLVAQRLYERYGFTARGVRRGYYSDNHEDALLMVRELPQPKPQV